VVNRIKKIIVLIGLISITAAALIGVFNDNKTLKEVALWLFVAEHVAVIYRSKNFFNKTS
jgi:hypothetical membrane protein